MLNPDLEQDAVAELLKVMVQMILKPKEGGAPSCLETMGKLLKEDLNNASQKEDISFIKQIIVPLLHAEEKSHIRINFAPSAAAKDDSKIDPEMRMPVYWEKQGQADSASDQAADGQKDGKDSGSGGKRQSKKQFFLKTDLLTDKMKEHLEKRFVELRKDRMPEVTQMVQSEWKQLYSQKKGEKGNSHSQACHYWLPNGFKEMAEACEGKSNILVLIKGKQGMNYSGGASSNQDIVIGCFSHMPFPANLSSSW